MKIFIFGNCGTGKSNLIDDLKKLIPAQVVAVDDFREKYGNNTWGGEQKAVKEFINAITTDGKDQIIECSGSGRTGERLLMKMHKLPQPVFVFILLADPQLCIERVQYKDWAALKMPGQKMNLIRQQVKSSLSIKWDYAQYRPVEMWNENVKQMLTNVNFIKNMVIGEN